MIIKIFKSDLDISQNVLEKTFIWLFRDYLCLVSETADMINMNYVLSKIVDEDISILDVLSYASKFISVMVENDIVKVVVHDNIDYKGVNLTSLLKTIKYGNLEVRGIDILDNACNYVLSNM